MQLTRKVAFRGIPRMGKSATKKVVHCVLGCFLGLELE